ncbi:hypothetical protein [Empedobacter sp. UBA7248]|uniref:hypothetical protein n=1 Tax=Empedobacter sp. UBA7248 TaxID=1946448 RepID=UPI0025C507C6|nr:hypothetical protein [Empedobacter sp. UBA7248]
MKKNLLFFTIFLSVLTFGQVGINTSNPQGLFNIDGKLTEETTNPSSGAPTSKQFEDDFIVTNSGATGIGTIPNVYAMLDVISTNKGLLVPRITLNSNTMDLNADGDNDISNQPQGLLIYNIGTALPKGYYFWNGTEWRSIEDTTSVKASASVNCVASIIDPSQSIDGDTPKPILSGSIIKVPYTGGNGGKFTGVTLQSIGNPNITATIADGKLEYGSGYLVFALQGMPIASQTSPIGISFDLTSFFEVNTDITGCKDITVGTQMNADIKIIAVMDYMKFVTDPDTGVKGFTVNATTPDGLYTIKVFMRHSIQNNTATSKNNTYRTDSGTENNVLIRNNTADIKTIMWNYNTEYGGYIGDAGGSLKVPSKIPGGGVGNTWRTLSTSNTGAWADQGIYNASNSGPEHRRYTWIDTTSNTKVAYTAIVMAGMDPTAVQTDVEKLKVYIKIEQVTGL